MAEITKAQIKAIHVRLSYAGIEDDDYRALLRQQFQAASCKELTRHQAHQLIVRLHGGRAKPKPAQRRKRQPIKTAAAPSPPDSAAVIAMISPAQRDLIEVLISEIKWHTAGGYSAWLKLSIGLQSISTARDAMRVIDGLKGLKRHGHSND